MLNLCEDKTRINKNVKILIQVADLFDIPVVFSTHNGQKLGGCVRELETFAADPVTLDKMEFSCFQNEQLHKRLNSFKRKTLLLCGLETHVCIFHTAAHGLRLGWNVHVAADAVASRKRFDNDIGIRRLEKAGAVISSTEMILFELLQKAGTAEFRNMLPTIKKMNDF